MFLYSVGSLWNSFQAQHRVIQRYHSSGKPTIHCTRFWRPFRLAGINVSLSEVNILWWSGPRYSYLPYTWLVLMENDVKYRIRALIYRLNNTPLMIKWSCSSCGRKKNFFCSLFENEKEQERGSNPRWHCLSSPTAQVLVALTTQPVQKNRLRDEL